MKKIKLEIDGYKFLIQKDDALQPFDIYELNDTATEKDHVGRAPNMDKVVEFIINDVIPRLKGE